MISISDSMGLRFYPYRTVIMGLRGEVYSGRLMSGPRTYFFNVKENRRGDLFLNLVESKKHGETGFERHQVLIFDEDIEQFKEEFDKAVSFMKKSGSSSNHRPNRERPPVDR